MTPEMQKMQAQIADLLQWKAARERQQISFPLDDASRNSLGVPTFVGAGSSDRTDTVGVAATPTSISVPAAYVGTIIISINGTQYEIPYIA